MQCKRRITQVAGMCAGLAGAAPVLAHANPDGSWDHHGMMWGGAGWFMGPIFMLLFVALCVAIVVVAVRWFVGAGDSSGSLLAPKQGSARQVLEERFARGEIDEEEFRQRRKALDE